MVLAGVLALLVLGAVASFGLRRSGDQPTFDPQTGTVLASVNYFDKGVRWTAEALYVGSTQQFSVDSSGNVITTGTFSATGAATFGGALSITGALTSGLFTQGGGVTASSTGASVTMAGTEFDTENVLDYTINGAATTDVTLTLSASTTAICPSTAGQSRTIYIRNATTSATADLTVAGGTGVLLKKATTTAVIYGDTDGANFARLDIVKKANTDCEALMSIFMD